MFQRFDKAINCSTKRLRMMAGVVLFFYLVSCASGSVFDNRKCPASNLNSCGSKTCPASASCLTVTWANFSPYAYPHSVTQTLSGIIPGLLSRLLTSCCGLCWKTNLTDPVQYQSLVVGKFGNATPGVVLPLHLHNGQTKKFRMHFVALVENPSVVYITKKQSIKKIPTKLIGAIWNAWPVLIMALLLSLLAGVLLWFLELWKNNEEFPASFFKGSWEGFWWAFVSMTTVGYGDRAPKSILGRGFAIFWILIGICICSIFTATLTTALTSITLEEVKTLNRAKVGAIRHSLESITGVKSQAKVVPYNSSDELWNALYDEHVEGILLDSYLSATPTLSDKIEAEDLRISETVKSEQWSYGVLVNDTTLANCMKMEFAKTGASIASLLISYELESQEDSENEVELRSASIFDPTGDLFWPSLYTCIGFIVVMIAFGLLWEFVLKTRCLKLVKTEPGLNGSSTNLDKLENEMISEIQLLFTQWRAKIAERGIAGPMAVEEMEGKL